MYVWVLWKGKLQELSIVFWGFTWNCLLAQTKSFSLNHPALTQQCHHCFRLRGEHSDPDPREKSLSVWQLNATLRALRLSSQNTFLISPLRGGGRGIKLLVWLRLPARTLLGGYLTCVCQSCRKRCRTCWWCNRRWWKNSSPGLISTRIRLRISPRTVPAGSRART